MSVRSRCGGGLEADGDLACNDADEQDGCDGESDDAHAVPAVPGPVDLLPIGSALGHAYVEWDKEEYGCYGCKQPDSACCQQKDAPSLVPKKPGLDAEEQQRYGVPDCHYCTQYESKTT